MQTRRSFALALVGLFAGAPGAAQEPPVRGSCVQVNEVAMAQASKGQLAAAEASIAAGDLDRGVCAGVVTHNVAGAMLALGRFRDAERMARESIRILEGIDQVDDTMLLKPLQTLASVLLQSGETAKARDAIERMQRMRVDNPEDAAVARATLGVLRQIEGRLPEAEAQYEVAFRGMQAAGRGESADAAAILDCLASLYLREKRLDEAHRVLERSGRIYSLAADTLPIDRAKFLGLRGILRARLGAWRESEQDLREALAIADSQPSVDPAVLRLLLTSYSPVLRRIHRGREAHAINARIAALPTVSAASLVAYADLLIESGTHKR